LLTEAAAPGCDLDAGAVAGQDGRHPSGISIARVGGRDCDAWVGCRQAHEAVRNHSLPLILPIGEPFLREVRSAWLAHVEPSTPPAQTDIERFASELDLQTPLVHDLTRKLVEVGLVLVGGRAALNAPWTFSATAFATATGSNCDWEVELTVACYGGASWADGPRGGFTAGNTFITENTPAELAASAQGNGTTTQRILQHERAHSTQWSILGGSTPFLYGLDWVTSLGGDECTHLFEQNANLSDGGYNNC
jgi:hypothetical protein